MKVLWLVNIVMPELAKNLEKESTVFGGWLVGASKALLDKSIDLVICTTISDTGRTNRYCINGISYYISPAGNIADMQKEFREILDQEKPDIVHIYGTEFEHSLAMFREADKNSTVVQIQGSMIYLKENVFAGIPYHICHDNLFHKILRMLKKGGNSIELQKNRYEKRAVYEEEILHNSKYVIGGSEWGNAVARSVNPKCETFDCKLILRDSFYTEETWNIEKCEPYSIYVLHSYPIKGFHKFLEALKIVVGRYPEVKAYVVANKLQYRQFGKLKSLIMDAAPDYDWYLQKLIDSYNLNKHIRFLGYLNETQVKERMLKSHVFVSPSAIENQSTTLGEAMILGVPSVASCVGAIQEMIHDGDDGFLYPFNEPYILANQIIRIFENKKLAKQFSINGHLHAAETYDKERNCANLIKMYEYISSKTMD